MFAKWTPRKPYRSDWVHSQTGLGAACDACGKTIEVGDIYLCESFDQGERRQHMDCLPSNHPQIAVYWRERCERAEVALVLAEGRFRRRIDKVAEVLRLTMETAERFERQASRGSGGRRGGRVFEAARAMLLSCDEWRHAPGGES